MIALNLQMSRAVGSASFWMVTADGAVSAPAPAEERRTLETTAAPKVIKRRAVSRLTIQQAVCRAARELRDEAGQGCTWRLALVR
jgi:hypothetical protein